MRPSTALALNRMRIRLVVASHRAKNARVFGSVLHGEDNEDSDLDILVDPSPEASLFDISAIQAELEEILCVKVDVLTPDELPEKIREHVIAEALPV